MKKILIVDDEEAVCWALDRALTREGHRVLTASSSSRERNVRTRLSWMFAFRGWTV
jgi:DNA-binding NtrC family response regulator